MEWSARCARPLHRLMLHCRNSACCMLQCLLSRRYEICENVCEGGGIKSGSCGDMHTISNNVIIGANIFWFAQRSSAPRSKHGAQSCTRALLCASLATVLRQLRTCATTLRTHKTTLRARLQSVRTAAAAQLL